MNNKYICQVEYQRRSTRKYCINLNKNTDIDIINHLDSVYNKQAYIKGLIIADIQKGSQC